MEKALILKALTSCIEACENLATASTHNQSKTMYKDCLSAAIDCADTGMMLTLKINKQPEVLHRNLFKQFIDHCKACAQVCGKYNEPQARHALKECKLTIDICHKYIEEFQQVDEYYYLTPTSMQSRYMEKLRQVFPG